VADRHWRGLRQPYWTRLRCDGRSIRGGLLSGRDRSEHILLYRRDALLTDEDRARWDRAMREHLGLAHLTEDLEARLGRVERSLADRRASTKARDWQAGGIELPEGIA
jgi:hypothetical protein